MRLVGFARFLAPEVFLVYINFLSFLLLFHCFFFIVICFYFFFLGCSNGGWLATQSTTPGSAPELKVHDYLPAKTEFFFLTVAERPYMLLSLQRQSRVYLYVTLPPKNMPIIRIPGKHDIKYRL